jgi:hypothetical protein
MSSCFYTSDMLWYTSGVVKNMYGCDGVARNMI